MKNNLRTITAYLPKGIRNSFASGQVGYRLSSFFFLLFLIIAGILLQTLVFLNAKTGTAKREREIKDKDYSYWSSVASQYPAIPDILYNAALSALNDGRKKEAMEYIDKALRLDPLFKKAIELKNEIERRG